MSTKSIILGKILLYDFPQSQSHDSSDQFQTSNPNADFIEQTRQEFFTIFLQKLLNTADANEWPSLFSIPVICTYKNKEHFTILYI